MKYPSTPIKDWTSRYRFALKKCFLLYMAVVVGLGMPFVANAETIIDSPLESYNPNDLADNDLTINARVNAYYGFTIADGKKIEINNTKLRIRDHLKITGGEITVTGADEESGLGGYGVNISGGTIRIHDADLREHGGENGVFIMTGGNIEISSSETWHAEFGSEGDTQDRGKVGGTVIITGGNILVKSGQKNYLLGKDITMSGGTLDIANGAWLNAVQGDNGRPKATINLQGQGVINLAGTLNSNVSGTGTINVKAGNNAINGDVVVGTIATETGSNWTLNNQGATATNINLAGGTVTLKNEALLGSMDEVGQVITISGATVNITGGSEIAADEGTLTVNASSVVNASEDGGLIGGTANMNGGTVNLSSGALFNAYSTFNMTAGTVNMAGGYMGAEGTATPQPGGIDYYTGGTTTLSGGTINVKSGSNYLFGTTINANNTINIAGGATLQTVKEYTEYPAGSNPDFVLGGTSTIALGNAGRVNLSGKLVSGVSGTGEVVFKTSGAALDGNVTGAKLSFDASHRLSNAITGNIGAISALNVNAGTLSYDKAATSIGAVNVAGGAILDIGTNTLTTSGTATFADNSTLAFRVSGQNAGEYGAINANAFNIGANGTNLTLTLDNGVLAKDETKTFTILKGSNITPFANLSTNSRYEFIDNGDGTFDIIGKATAADVVGDAGGSSNTAGTATSWLDSGTHAAGTKAASVGDHLNMLSQQADGKALVAALDALAPDAAPVVHAQAQAQSQQIFNVAGARMDNAQQGRSGGDAFQNAGLWAQGLYNRTKLDKKSGFDVDSYGIAFGGDAYLTDNFKAGLGFAYTQSDIDSTGRSTDVDTYSVFAYGQQNFGKLFVNGALTYGWSNYDETKDVGGLKIGADYDTKNIGAQAITGYHFGLHQNGILTPEAGLRYLYSKQDNYTDDAGQHVKSDSTDTLTGLLGTRYAYTYRAQSLNIISEIRAVATYDLIDADNSAVVRLANGSSYRIEGEGLKRFGMEAGAKLGVEVGNMEFSLAYEGQFRSDYTDHTGLAAFRYNF